MKVIQSFPHFRNFETPTWESRDKKPFRCGPLERHKVHYKGEGGGFPQVRAVVSLMCPNSASPSDVFSLGFTFESLKELGVHHL